jgi:hypothetical protein
VKVKDGEVELCPGVRLATGVRLPLGKDLPRGVTYCYVKKDAPLLKGIKQIPYNLVDRVPEIRGSTPLLLPPSLQLSNGINLVLGTKLPPGIELPSNVMIVHAPDFASGVKLPRGMKEVNLSGILKTPDNFRLPSMSTTRSRGSTGGPTEVDDASGYSLILAQVHTTLTLPSGVEIAPGCEIADYTEDSVLPYGVQVRVEI